MFGSTGKALGGALPGMGGGAAAAAIKPLAGTAQGSAAPGGAAPPVGVGLGGLLKGAAGAGGGVGAMNRGAMTGGGGIASKIIAQNPGFAQMAQTPKASLAQQPGLAQGPAMQGALSQVGKQFGMKRSMRGGKR
jgi:hypothetical protein